MTLVPGARLGPSEILGAIGLVIPAVENEAAIDRQIELARRLEYDLIKTYLRLPDALQQRAIDGRASHRAFRSARTRSTRLPHSASTEWSIPPPPAVGVTHRKLSPLLRAYDDVVALVAGSGMTMTPTLSLGRSRPAIIARPELRSDPRWQIQPEWVRAQFGPDASQGRSTSTTPCDADGVPQGGRADHCGHSRLVPYGISLHLELEIYVAAGLTAFESLQTATANVARALHVGRDVGTVEPGKLADLAIVEGNPLADIRTTRNVRMVVVNGVVIRVEALASGTASRRWP